MQIFIAGIMQGARSDHLIDDQTYRVQITHAINAHLPEAHVYDPWALSPGSVDFDSETARNTFHTHLQQVENADALIAYLPRASMGTAMEMWQAYQNNVPILAVSPMQHHWAIRFTAHEVLPDLDSLMAYIAGGKLHTFVQNGHGNNHSR
jgi:nucleoside 2-deoxyribosyltransferase